LRHHVGPRESGPLPRGPARTRVVLDAVGPKLFAEAGIGQKTPRGRDLVLVDQNAPLEGADRALEHAYVLIGDYVRNSRAVEQRLDGRDHDRIIGSHEFAHRPTHRQLPAAGGAVGTSNTPPAQYLIDPPEQSVPAKGWQPCIERRV
jgi:hypothetical protein